jgi:ADP-ribosylglycohydrolase
MPDARSRIHGCILGLAVGDALGAPVEFHSITQIRDEHGPDGVRDLHPWHGFPAGSYTDDTQMSLATAQGLMRAHNRFLLKGICHPPSVVYGRYQAWVETQDDPLETRAPGHTCLHALRSGRMGGIESEDRLNNSKGCGGVMRTAPVGLAARMDVAFTLGAECAALTHGHPSGYLSAGYLSEMIAHLSQSVAVTEAARLPLESLSKCSGCEETRDAVVNALKLAESSIGTDRALAELGGGWVGEEALAIALFCALRSPNDYTRGTLMAVNHSGDSDSTGSIAGAILGTALGVEAIPDRWMAKVENRPLLEKTAEDLYRMVVLDEELSWDEYPGM